MCAKLKNHILLITFENGKDLICNYYRTKTGADYEFNGYFAKNQRQLHAMSEDLRQSFAGIVGDGVIKKRVPNGVESARRECGQFGDHKLR
ncbi:hypothetical protein TcasGA2_TC009475 [Tribolium castaneum]|uniref:Uncharacterized protein n=1 Tax=Tribolium castaneum TaxID=7070 RepID=D6WRG4_TRICA|nr:hypothetical protein TcasGA2_TC009475 [Tribolium castaneum]